MKHARKAILAGSAFLCATSLSFGWPDHGGLPLSVASAQARVGRPATPVSVAGVARRHVRRGAYVGYGFGYDIATIPIPAEAVGYQFAVTEPLSANIADAYAAPEMEEGGIRTDRKSAGVQVCAES